MKSFLSTFLETFSLLKLWARRIFHIDNELSKSDCLSLSPDAQAQSDERGLSEVGGDHPGAPGGGAAVPAKVGAVLRVKPS